MRLPAEREEAMENKPHFTNENKHPVALYNSWFAHVFFPECLPGQIEAR